MEEEGLMRDVSLKELLEAGCHFGHQVTRQNPRAREFIFQAREGIHVIDLVKTKEGLLQAAAFVRDVAAKGGRIIFVGTKRQAQSIVEAAVKRANGSGEKRVFIVSERWIGGSLTNFEQVAKNYHKLKDLISKLGSDVEKAKYTKKEVGMWDKERVKLEKLYGGMADLTALPDAIFIVDTHKEDLAVKEAIRMSVPVVGIVDTNADPNLIDYPIPANDDAVGSIQLIVDYITGAWMEGSKLKVQSETRSAGSGQALKVEGEIKETEETEEKKIMKTKVKTTKKKEGKGGKRKPQATKKA